MLRKTLLALALTAGASAATASTGTYSALGQGVVKGFAVQMATINEVTQKQVALPAGFDELTSPMGAVHTHPDLAQGVLHHLSDSSVRVCLEFLPLTIDSLTLAVSELTASGWRIAAPWTCPEPVALSTPQKFPAAIAAHRTLDANKVPLSTSVAEFPIIEPPLGARHKALTLPSFTVYATEGTGGEPVHLRITNPNPEPDIALLQDPETAPLFAQLWEEASTVLTELTVPEPFYAYHTCSSVGPQQTCEVLVALNAEFHRDVKPLAGTVFMSFDGANYTRIGITGQVVAAEPLSEAEAPIEPEALPATASGVAEGEPPPVPDREYALPYCDPQLVKADETSCRLSVEVNTSEPGLAEADSIPEEAVSPD